LKTNTTKKLKIVYKAVNYLLQKNKVEVEFKQRKQIGVKREEEGK
jgi:hypothetical protein